MIYKLLPAILPLLTLVTIVGCDTSNPDIVRSSRVFKVSVASNRGGGQTIASPEPPPSPTPAPTPSPQVTRPPGPAPAPTPSPIPNRNIQVMAQCPNDEPQMEYLDQAADLQLILSDPSRGFATSCITNNGVYSAALGKEIDLSACPPLLENVYALTLRDPANGQRINLQRGFRMSAVYSTYIYRTSSLAPWNLATGIQASDMTLAQSWGDIQSIASSGMDAYVDMSSATGTLIQIENSRFTAIDDGSPSLMAYSVSAGPQCDFSGDPLVIDTAPQDDTGKFYLEMTSMLNGVFFDLLGSLSMPIPHSPKKVSWIHSPNYMFLALPNANGVVLGVDQLFGNFTRGPDGRYPTDGFAALAKFDSNHDGKIDANDPVFSQLKLWGDVNGDGVALPGELHSLSEYGVQSIDLNYNSSFSETDQYGNIAKYKSTAYTTKGPRLVFDLWMKFSR